MKHGETRGKILKLLDREIEMSKINIAKILNVSWSLANYHIKKLEEIKVVKVESFRTTTIGGTLKLVSLV